MSIGLYLQALAELLKVTHRGYFIPPRPEKNPVEGQRASDDFVELRRNALEKYLVQLAMHPAIAQSDVSHCCINIFCIGHCSMSSILMNMKCKLLRKLINIFMWPNRKILCNNILQRELYSTLYKYSCGPRVSTHSQVESCGIFLPLKMHV